MEKWGIVLCTYGNSEQRLTKLLESLHQQGEGGIPFDLWIRGSVLTYQQELAHREIAERYGAEYMESARWRVYEPARAIRIVQNPYIAILKDDIVMGKHWLEAMDFFWENNERVGSVGWGYIQAEELVAAGIWEEEDDFWTKPIPSLSRKEILELIPIEKRSVDYRAPVDTPTLTDAPCPMAWTLRREDFVRLNGFVMVGPGDNSCMYADLCWDHGLICVNIPFPPLFHRRETSTREYCRDRNIPNLGHDPGIWRKPHLEEEYCKRWEVPSFWWRRNYTTDTYIKPLLESRFLSTLRYWSPKNE